MQEKLNPVAENAVPHTFTKSIGKTIYEVSVYANNANRETLHSKLLRLMKNDLTQG